MSKNASLRAELKMAQEDAAQWECIAAEAMQAQEQLRKENEQLREALQHQPQMLTEQFDIQRQLVQRFGEYRARLRRENDRLCPDAKLGRLVRRMRPGMQLRCGVHQPEGTPRWVLTFHPMKYMGDWCWRQPEGALLVALGGQEDDE